MLAASMDFIRNEMGVDTIYYHSAKIGPKVKRIVYAKPPFSLTMYRWRIILVKMFSLRVKVRFVEVI